MGAAVREQRLRLGWTQQLAEAMGVSRKWVNEFESGKARPSFASCSMS